MMLSWFLNGDIWGWILIISDFYVRKFFSDWNVDNFDVRGMFLKEVNEIFFREMQKINWMNFLESISLIFAISEPRILRNYGKFNLK